jgi:hypothetical protein
MFRQIATRLQVAQLFDLHPLQIVGLLERVWNRRIQDNDPNTGDPLGHPDNRSLLNEAPVSFPPLSRNNNDPDPLPRGGNTDYPLRWDHLIYAYMVENTRMFEIFRRVVFEMVHGEKLGTPLPDAQRWLRNTEELFFKPGAPFLITSVVSDVRNDFRAIGRNAYRRMFGMELNHGTDDGKPYPYVKADASNMDFVSTFEEFLREVWIGITYVTATSSSNPTDDAKIADLAEKLHDMLRSRRQNGNLSREEFSLVTCMSWFHLTLEAKDTAIVRSLRADATGTEQRLFKIAERVGLPAHGLSKHFFNIADPLSRILIQIETGEFNSVNAVPALYTRPPGQPPSGGIEDSPEAAMRQIITDWTAITGRDVKARKVASG